MDIIHFVVKSPEKFAYDFEGFKDGRNTTFNIIVFKLAGQKPVFEIKIIVLVLESGDFKIHKYLKLHDYGYKLIKKNGLKHADDYISRQNYKNPSSSSSSSSSYNFSSYDDKIHVYTTELVVHIPDLNLSKYIKPPEYDINKILKQKLDGSSFVKKIIEEYKTELLGDVLDFLKARDNFYDKTDSSDFEHQVINKKPELIKSDSGSA